MRNTSLGIFLLMVILFTSCAERYTTRKRIAKRSNSTENVVIENRKKPQEPEKKSVTLPSDPNTDFSNKSVSNTVNSNKYTNEKQQVVIDTALSFLGTPYRYGGTTRKGMDCSALVGTSFEAVNISLNRSSHEMAKQGEDVDLDQVIVGDLLFFVTGKSKRISHVGIVVEHITEIKFIHASTSRGVIISSLNEGYWSKAYRKAKRVLM
ncbi:C40 family peptidase [Capnocytophaga canimorsus]|uniref:Secreted peptidase-related protein n=2 Tax=Capnocytophaga canimorsus TaxID=28188 RepID=F9YVT5_CAPCC|nr:C40 family peptidase [Capnocytophaga canimorsus]AEK23249.1 Putative secreted peptidase-related protein [Capnocytophaga canimorsus Cc5]ATA90959.1 peptidase [Capnocytophaga canimorsus]CEN53490.1 putative secreted peptidase-related protein [Capnocytophaga canimorsus]